MGQCDAIGNGYSTRIVNTHLDVDALEAEESLQRRAADARARRLEESEDDVVGIDLGAVERQ